MRKHFLRAYKALYGCSTLQALIAWYTFSEGLKTAVIEAI